MFPSDAISRAQPADPAADAAPPPAAAGCASPGEHPVPLVVALEGCLVATDLMMESLLLLATDKPLELVRLPWWLAQGRAQFKRRLAQEVSLDVQTLPYRRDLLAYLEAEKRAGRRLILATSIDEGMAHLIARELGLFDGVLASDGASDLAGARMRNRLVSEFGTGGFDYAGHSGRDQAIWRAARKVVLVRPSPRLRKAEANTSKLERVFADERSRLQAYLHALRVDHWVKNLLVFLPIVAAHRLYDLGLLAHALLAAIAFALCASSIYLLNDLTDLAHDRRHPHKKERMLASGELSIGSALALVPLLLGTAFLIGATLPSGFLSVMGAYFLLMIAYSVRIKDFLGLDVLTIATGYTLRVVAGAVAATLPAPPWLLVSSLLFFAGLTLLKRYAELVTMRAVQGESARARAYRADQRPRVALMGCATGYLGVLVLAAHAALDGQNFRSAPVWIFFLLLLYWLTHMWLMAERGRITGDPVAFALRDRATRIVAVLMAATVAIAP